MTGNISGKLRVLYSDPKSWFPRDPLIRGGGSLTLGKEMMAGHVPLLLSSFLRRVGGSIWSQRVGQSGFDGMIESLKVLGRGIPFYIDPRGPFWGFRNINIIMIPPGTPILLPSPS